MNQAEVKSIQVPSARQPERPVAPLNETRRIGPHPTCGDGRSDTARETNPAEREMDKVHIFGGIFSPALIVAELANIDDPNVTLDIAAEAAGGELRWHTDTHTLHSENPGNPGCKHIDGLLKPEFAELYNPGADEPTKKKAVERATALYAALPNHPKSVREVYDGGHAEGQLAINDVLDVTPVSPNSNGEQIFVWDRAATEQWAREEFLPRVKEQLSARQMSVVGDFDDRFVQRLGEHMAATKELLVDQKGLPTVVIESQGNSVA